MTHILHAIQHNTPVALHMSPRQFALCATVVLLEDLSGQRLAERHLWINVSRNRQDEHQICGVLGLN